MIVIIMFLFVVMAFQIVMNNLVLKEGFFPLQRASSASLNKVAKIRTIKNTSLSDKSILSSAHEAYVIYINAIPRYPF